MIIAHKLAKNRGLVIKEAWAIFSINVREKEAVKTV
jgi:hypothetical protein